MYLICDVETTGLKENSEVCQIAWQEVDKDLNIISKFSSLVKPKGNFSPSASGIHGITADKVKDAPTLEEVFRDFSNHRAVTFIGHNCAFDIKFVSPFMHIESSICTLRVCRRYLSGIDDYKLPTIKYYLELNVGDKAHDAMADVETCRQLLLKLCRDMNTDLVELEEAMTVPVLYDEMPWGKHKDMPIKKIPTGYLRWVQSLEDLDPDMRATINGECRRRGLL